MDITLETTTDELAATIGRAIAWSDAGMDLRPEQHDELAQAVLDTVCREAVRRVRPESREREVLAALDRASGGLEGYVVHNRATGDRTTGGDQAETRTILGHLVALGYVEQRGGFDSTRGGRTSKYSITGPGREALRA